MSCHPALPAVVPRCRSKKREKKKYITKDFDKFLMISVKDSDTLGMDAV